MKAIMYAAGRGTRLGEAAGGLPKLLLEFGGRSLLAWHIARLKAVGVSELVVVTGFRRERIVAALEEQRELAWREVYNPDFSLGSSLSFRASLPELEGDEAILLMDGDVLYPTAMLEALVRSSEPTALLIDREFSMADDDPVLAPIRDGRPFELQKRWSGAADAVGESIGFFKVAGADLPRLRQETERVAAIDDGQLPFEEALRAMVQADLFAAVDVTGLPWIEIDFPGDVEQAENEVLPAILARES